MRRSSKKPPDPVKNCRIALERTQEGPACQDRIGLATHGNPGADERRPPRSEENTDSRGKRAVF
jgi:hypothetical protein